MPGATLSRQQQDELLNILKTRFECNMKHHKGLAWADLQARLQAGERKLASLHQMEATGGEPDVVGFDRKTGEYIFYDCAPQSPIGRRSICYDRPGQKKREEEGLQIAGNVLDMAAAMGIEPLSEEEYRHLQTLSAFDTKSQSWLKTPAAIAELGGAIFADRHYNTVFVYHNTAPCFYRARGFRGSLRV